jgi:hypothetical protein
MDGQDGEKPIRTPKDLKGLLNMSLQVAGLPLNECAAGTGEPSSPTPNPSVQVVPKDPDPSSGSKLRSADSTKSKWLQDVLASLAVNVPDELKKNLQQLCSLKSTSEDQVCHVCTSVYDYQTRILKRATPKKRKVRGRSSIGFHDQIAQSISFFTERGVREGEGRGVGSAKFGHKFCVFRPQILWFSATYSVFFGLKSSRA